MEPLLAHRKLALEALRRISCDVRLFTDGLQLLPHQSQLRGQRGNLFALRTCLAVRAVERSGGYGELPGHIGGELVDLPERGLVLGQTR